jgi:hypothetical protein
MPLLPVGVLPPVRVVKLETDVPGEAPLMLVLPEPAPEPDELDEAPVEMVLGIEVAELLFLRE